MSGFAERQHVIAEAFLFACLFFDYVFNLLRRGTHQIRVSGVKLAISLDFVLWHIVNYAFFGLVGSILDLPFFCVFCKCFFDIVLHVSLGLFDVGFRLAPHDQLLQECTDQHKQ
jgi:hypothetical protein